VGGSGIDGQNDKVIIGESVGGRLACVDLVTGTLVGAISANGAFGNMTKMIFDGYDVYFACTPPATANATATCVRNPGLNGISDVAFVTDPILSTINYAPVSDGTYVYFSQSAASVNHVVKIGPNSTVYPATVTEINLGFRVGQMCWDGKFLSVGGAGIGADRNLLRIVDQVTGALQSTFLGGFHQVNDVVFDGHDLWCCDANQNEAVGTRPTVCKNDPDRVNPQLDTSTVIGLMTGAEAMIFGGPGGAGNAFSRPARMAVRQTSKGPIIYVVDGVAPWIVRTINNFTMAD
jgi:hypothetical protein